MEQVTMTPPDVCGRQIEWEKLEVGDGIVLTPKEQPDEVVKILSDFAEAGPRMPGYELKKIYSEEEFGAPVVWGLGDYALRSFTDHYPNPESNLNYLNWLSSNLALEHALLSDKRYVIQDGRSMLVKPARIDGAALHVLDNGLTVALTLMGCIRGKMLEGLRRSAWECEAYSEFNGYGILSDAVEACVQDSLIAVYGERVGYHLLRRDFNYRNVMLAEDAVYRIDANGFDESLSRVLGDFALSRLANFSRMT